jgi:hypothetical protein
MRGVIARRRAVLAAAVAAPLLVGCSPAAVQRFPDVPAARAAVQGLLAANLRNDGAFSLPQVLHHLAQSIEFSLTGFPEAKSALFQHTAGAAAWAVFDARGAMTHGLGEPIPGAPPLAAHATLDSGVQRLVAALDRFAAHTGPLQPHFAYGALDKASYTRAHLMHLANHWHAFVPAA